METLIISFALAVGISAFCSLAEAVLYSIPWSHIEKMRGEGKRSGDVLYSLRQRVDEPITAILTLNTVAHTAGAAVAGAAAAKVYGESSMFTFSVVFTLVILIFSEIIPKTIGVLYNRPFSLVLAYPLKYMVLAFFPAIKSIGVLVNLMGKNRMGPDANEEDILAMVSLTRKSGGLKRFEELSIQNILALDDQTVREVMTPRTVIFSLPAENRVCDVWDGNHVWPYSRVPVYAEGDPEEVVGIVYRREVLEALAEDKKDRTLQQMMKPVHFVLENLTLDRVLVKFLESRIHLAVVLDEYGGLAGIISLEDILEEILGDEIMDETDQVADMRQLALEKKQELLRNKPGA